MVSFVVLVFWWLALKLGGFVGVNLLLGSGRGATRRKVGFHRRFGAGLFGNERCAMIGWVGGGVDYRLVQPL